MFSLSQKKALITGASGGIGNAIATHYYDAGAELLLSGSKQEKLDATRNVILSEAKDPGKDSSATPQNDRIYTLTCDLSQLDTIDGFAKAAEEKLGGLDVLVCNAGLTRDTLALRMKDEQWQQVIDVNLTSTFRLIRAAMRGMLKRNYGRIIIVTSVVGHTGNPGQANYCASKGGLTAMAKALALEVATRGVTVNCIAPGFIETPMTGVLTDEQKSRITQTIPMNRIGTPADIAAAALFLASTEASYVTGQTVHVNGGMYMG